MRENILFYIIKYIYKKTQHLLIIWFSYLYSKPIDIDKLDNTLIIAPHPDDEVFGCGYLINELCNKKKNITLIILSQGEACHTQCCLNREVEIIEKRKELAIKANHLLGLPQKNIYFLKMPDGRLESVLTNSSYTEELNTLIKKINPSSIFYPHPFENSPDHFATTRMIKNLSSIANTEQYYYCVWTWYHMPMHKVFKLKFRHSFTVRTNNRDLKEKAINIYTVNSAPCGVSYSGNLPKMFLKAFKWNKELYFSVNK